MTKILPEHKDNEYVPNAGSAGTHLHLSMAKKSEQFAVDTSALINQAVSEGWTIIGFISNEGIKSHEIANKYSVSTDIGHFKLDIETLNKYYSNQLVTGGSYVFKAPTINNNIDELVEAIPALEAIVTHPVKGCTTKLKNVIIDLNDGYEWTREQIADWLDSLDLDLSFSIPEETNDVS